MKSSVCFVFSAQPAGKGLELLSGDHSLALRGDDRAASISSLSLVLCTKQGCDLHPWHLYSWQAGPGKPDASSPATSK